MAVVEAKPLGLQTVKWTGGEPTIHPQFARLLALEKKHALRGRLETNGLEMTAALARLMAESGVRHVSVSLDGAHEQTHDSIRGVRGAYRRALNGIANLVGVGYRPQLIMSLLPENVGELDALLDLAARVGAGSVKLNIVQPTLRGEGLRAHGDVLTIEQLLQINQRIDQLQSKYGYRIFFDLPMAFRPLRRLLNGDVQSVCGIMHILGLLADGSYALCGIGVHVPEMVFGRVGRDALQDIWRSHRVLAQIRKGVPGELKGVCGQCIMRTACLGSCIAQNYYRSRDLFAPFWLCEEALAAGLFPRERLVD